MFTKVARDEDHALAIAEAQYERCNYTVSVIYPDSNGRWFHLFGRYWKTILNDVTDDVHIFTGKYGTEVYLGGSKEEFNFATAVDPDDIVRCCSVHAW